MPWELTGNAGTNPSNDFLGTTDNQPLVVKTNGTEAIRVTADEKVGIGNSNPNFKLEVTAQDQLGLAVQGPNSGVGAGLQLQSTGPGAPGGPGGRGWELLATGATSAQGEGKFNIRDLGATRDVFTITSEGQVGIGATDPGAKLRINAIGDPNALHVASDTNGIYAIVDSPGPNGLVAQFIAIGPNDGVAITCDPQQQGLSVIGGKKSAVVATSQGARALYTEEASEVWFADYGFGYLQEGSSIIKIDPLFAETVNLDKPYHVFVQAYGDAELYVNQRTSTAFEVCLRAGNPNVEFSYRLVARRQGLEEVRLEHIPRADNDPHLYPEKRTE